MMMSKILSIGFSLFVLVFVVELVRREKLTFKYASGWILVALIALFFSTCEGCLFAISEALGFKLPSNFIFFALLCMFIFLSLLLTVFLCQQDKRNNTIAQQMGILEQELEQLKEKKSGENV